ncbi:MAG: hypothetical protein JNK47_10915 [Mesorhizobium sp.]|nr:hypothetical protein [Mesorhizobium sp.]MBL8577729.1 hypothetical protein [Mesorhizobium sp.]
MTAFAMQMNAGQRYVVGRTLEALEHLIEGRFEEYAAIDPVYFDTIEQKEADPAVARAALGITAMADKPRTIADATSDFWSRQKRKSAAPAARRRDDAPKPVEVADDGPDADDLPPLNRVDSIDATAVYQRWNGGRRT